MILRSKLRDDVGSNRWKQCLPEEEPEDFSGVAQPPQDLPLIRSDTFQSEIVGTRLLPSKLSREAPTVLL